MHDHALIVTILFIGFFLAATSVLQTVARKTPIPYTVILLVAGFVSQLMVDVFQLHVPVTILPQFIFFVLLPLLLFESAMHVNFHQFHIQFKTIAFLATFGLLLSIFTVGTGAAYLLGIPLGPALLFGAIISATDPTAVLALFNNLGAPRRLALIAEGESMFNDAAAVIVFRLISSFVVVDNLFETHLVLLSITNFIFVFIASIIFGAIMGYITSEFIARVDNDRLVETTLTLARSPLL